jgi:aryl-phospho-beta-D-glucosidase BglC (GH1 family)
MFAAYCNAPEVVTLFRELYQNKLGTGDRFAAFWRALAIKFKDNGYVMGFDVLNEPELGPIDWVHTISDLIGGGSDREYMGKLFSKL